MTATLPARRALRRLDPPPGQSRRRAPSRAVVQFVLAGLVALALLIVAGAVVSRKTAEREAVSDARRTAQTLAHAAVAPALTDGLLTGDPAAVSALDRVVRSRVLGNGIVRVKLWSPAGRVLYSDEPRLLGGTFPLDNEELAAIREDRVVAEVSNLSAPENRFERTQGKLLEVYLPLRAPSGQPVLFETYSTYDTVRDRSRVIWRQFIPITVGLLLLLQLVQLPLALSLARRLERGRRERERLLRRAIAASDAERRRIASDLHDGVVQDLAGVSYGLVACADQVARTGQPEVAEHLYDASGGVRQSIRALRSLLVEIYPPNLRAAGLGAALTDLLAPLAGRNVTVELELPDGLELPVDVEALVFRVAQEAVRNAVQHGAPGRLAVRLSLDGDDARLTVEDDGRGFDPARPATEGHVGLLLLADLVSDAGGRLDVASTPGAGTQVRLVVARR